MKNSLKDVAIVLMAVLLTGGLASAMSPTDVKSSGPSINSLQKVEAAEPAPKVEEPKPETPQVTWRDNPNNCNQDTQWIAQDPPHDCINKPVPTASVVPAAAPSASTSNGGCYEILLAQYDWDAGLMRAIMQAESGCNASAIGDNYVIAGLYAPSCGLLQIRTLAGRPSCEALQDPVTNIEWAYKVYSGQGYNAWSVYTNGKYLQYR